MSDQKQKKTRYACSRDRAFADQKGRQYQPGQLISARNLQEIGEERLQQLIAKGRIVEVDPSPPVDVEPPAPAQQRRKEGETIPSPWNLNPADLPESLDDLNLLILDIDGDAEAAKSAEEAIARLSADYKPEA